MEARVEGCLIRLERLKIVKRDAPCPLIQSRAVKQEIDRNEDLIRSCLRAVAALDALPGSREVQAWDGLMTSLIGGPGFKVGYPEYWVQRELTLKVPNFWCLFGSSIQQSMCFIFKKSWLQYFTLQYSSAPHRMP